MNKKEISVDITVIGAGITGLTCGIYAERAGLETIIFENNLVGGQMCSAPFIENYPGFEKISGIQLTEKIKKQALVCGAVIEEFDVINSVSFSDSEKIIETNSAVYYPRAVIIATGASPVKLAVENEKKWNGKGIHYCALCDGSLYKNKTVAVVGGGNSALECGIYLSKTAKEVIFIRRKDYFKGEQSLINIAETTKNIRILFNHDLISVSGDNHLNKVCVKDIIGNSEYELAVDGIFCCIGYEPESRMFRDYINTDEKGYIITDENMQTNIKNVFAAGDVRKKSFRQLTTSVADATVAVLNAQKSIVTKGGGVF